MNDEDLRTKLIDELKAEIERLRAESKANNDEAYRAWAMVQDQRDAVIEECAQFIRKCKFEAERDGWSNEDYEGAVRALKDKLA